MQWLRHICFVKQNMNNTDIFHKPIALLPVSNHFKEVMGKQDIKTLKEIVSIPITEVANLKWFTDEILAELSELLFKNKSLR
jgi:hypothetical protein